MQAGLMQCIFLSSAIQKAFLFQKHVALFYLLCTLKVVRYWFGGMVRFKDGLKCKGKVNR